MAGKVKENDVKSLAVLLSQDSVRRRFSDVFGNKIKAAAFVSSIMSAVSQNPGLKECDPMSVISAAAIAASLDLPINPSLGFAHIVPYKGLAQYQQGWRGFVQLGIRTAQYRAMNVSEVYKDELKKWNPIMGEIEFTFQETWKERYSGKGTLVGYVAFFKLLNGFEKYLYMTVGQIDAHARKYSPSYDNEKGQWKKNFDAMARKTVLKALLSKFGLLSIEMRKAIEADQAVIRPDGTYDYVDSYPSDIENASNGTGTPAKPDTAAPKSTDDTVKTKENGNKNTEPEEPLSVEEVLSVPIGVTVARVIGRLADIQEKCSKVTIFNYTIENNGVRVDITKFGSKLPDIKLDDYVICTNVKVGEYKNVRQYVAENIEIANLTGN